MNEPIEEYLDELYVQLHTDPRSARRLLDEAADHLHGAAGDLEAAGMPRPDAEREAVRRLGTSAVLARTASRRSFRRLLLDTAQAVAFLGAVGLVAVGFSGLLAAAMGALFGRPFVGGGLAQSLAGSSVSVSESAGDAVSLRVLAGLVGVVVLGALWFLRRSRPGLRLQVLPSSYVDLVGLVAFAGAALALGALSVDQAVQHSGNGVGFFLSGAIVSLAGAAAFGVRAVRSVLHGAGT